MSHHVGRPLHVGISVRSMDVSLAWYEQVLGFRLVKEDGFIPPLGARICFIEKDGFQLELFEYKEPKPIPADRLTPNSDLQTIGTKHVAFQTDNMAELKAHLLAHGADIALEVNMGCPTLFIRDPDGVLLEFIETN